MTALGEIIFFRVSALIPQDSFLVFSALQLGTQEVGSKW